ncbi:MAG: CapA family protein [Faecousia sp.]
MPPKKSNHIVLKIILILLMAAFIAGTVYTVKLCLDMPSLETEPRPSESIRLPSGNRESEPTETTAPPETTLPEPEHVVATASIASQGDLLMHGGVIRSGAQADGSYDFESVFRYVKEYVSGYDLALANLETTFGGDSNPYQGWPLFNVPDDFGDSIVEAGYDLLLTSNNHCYDTLMAGFKRTIEVSRDKGLMVLGSRLTEEEPNYAVVDLNGIKVGMVSYTYTTSMSGGKPSLNGNSPVENPALINYFSYTNLDKFYSEMTDILEKMKSEGAEATMLFIHWGTEYEIVENNYQDTIAQKVCDLGVDVIVGGHPHVVQPVELLSSTVNPEHKTVCIYSLGNAVSNQRISEMRLKTGHTEDGVLFAVTFEKYSDGTVYLAGAEVLPTWVDLSSVNGKLEYNILPLEDAKRDEWKERFNLTDSLYQNCVDSYQRTMDIVGPGMEQVQTWLTQSKQQRDDAYLAQVRGE